MASIKVNKLDQDLISDHLAAGIVDNAFSTDISVNADIYAKRLFTDDFVCMVTEEHDAIKDKVTIESFVKYSHIFFTPHEGKWGVVTDLLSQQGLKHRTIVYASHAYSIPNILMTTDCITIIPERLASAFSIMGKFRTLEAPVLIPELEMKQFWHLRTANDPPNIWIRREIENIFMSEINESSEL